ncbi:hypothetical protein FQA39_LY01864 [Lamprigera yunnana]|nr:hypothetical protein FQA39_LY01864 [Lamprigera yunnana]
MVLFKINVMFGCVLELNFPSELGIVYCNTNSNYDSIKHNQFMTVDDVKVVIVTPDPDDVTDKEDIGENDFTQSEILDVTATLEMFCTFIEYKMSFKQALQIHGHLQYESNDSDSGKSYFDEEYYNLKPPAVDIEKLKVVQIQPRKVLAIGNYVDVDSSCIENWKKNEQKYYNFNPPAVDIENKHVIKIYPNKTKVDVSTTTNYGKRNLKSEFTQATALESDGVGVDADEDFFDTESGKENGVWHSYVTQPPVKIDNGKEIYLINTKDRFVPTTTGYGNENSNSKFAQCTKSDSVRVDYDEDFFNIEEENSVNHNNITQPPVEIDYGVPIYLNNIKDRFVPTTTNYENKNAKSEFAQATTLKSDNVRVGSDKDFFDIQKGNGVRHYNVTQLPVRTENGGESYLSNTENRFVPTTTNYGNENANSKFAQSKALKSDSVRLDSNEDFFDIKEENNVSYNNVTPPPVQIDCGVPIYLNNTKDRFVPTTTKYGNKNTKSGFAQATALKSDIVRVRSGEDFFDVEKENGVRNYNVTPLPVKIENGGEIYLNNTKDSFVSTTNYGNENAKYEFPHATAMEGDSVGVFHTDDVSEGGAISKIHLQYNYDYYKGEVESVSNIFPQTTVTSVLKKTSGAGNTTVTNNPSTSESSTGTIKITVESPSKQYTDTTDLVDNSIGLCGSTAPLTDIGNDQVSTCNMYLKWFFCCCFKPTQMT